MMNFTHLDLSIIVSFYFDQKSADSLYNMLDYYDRFSVELKRKIQFVLIDDHSKIKIEIPNHLKLNYQLLRVKNDIQWNNGGARNLGVVNARTSKILMTDVDHVFPEELLRKIVAHVPRRNVFYKFKRVTEQGTKHRTPTNLLYTTKSVFFDVLGYDEEFSGNYGYEDTFFIKLLKHRKNRLRYFSRFKKVIETKVDRQNSYHSFSRDLTVNTHLLQKKESLLKAEGVWAAHSRLFLNFEWEKIEEKMNA